MCAPVGVMLLTFYFIAKSQSAASIYNKLWSLFYGEKEFYSSTINNFAKTQHDLDKFNFVYGFRFHTISQIELFLTWLEERNYQIHWFSHLGGLFNKETFDVHQTSTFKRWITFLLGLFALACFVLWVIYKIFSDHTGENPFIQYFASYIYALEILIFAGIILFLNKAQNKANETIRKMLNQDVTNVHRQIMENRN